MKNIVILSDGTGNSAASVWRTNVWRVNEILDRTQEDKQVVLYDEGVGTSPFLPDVLLGLLFGKGLKRNVLRQYKFLCRTYRDGDQIFAFGFSRGAFTVHTLVGLIAEHGIARYEGNEELLNAQARAAYRAYRLRKKRINIADAIIQTVRWYFSLPNYYDDERIFIDKINFVGLWDTVATL
jgi:uncharacterized protein (DUF2235 family)